MVRPKKKKCLVSGNPTDPTFWGPTLNFFVTSEKFSSTFRGFLMIFMLFLCKKKKKKKRKEKKSAYLSTLKNIKTFPETRLFFCLCADLAIQVSLVQSSSSNLSDETINQGLVSMTYLLAGC